MRYTAVGVSTPDQWRVTLTTTPPVRGAHRKTRACPVMQPCGPIGIEDHRAGSTPSSSSRRVPEPSPAIGLLPFVEDVPEGRPSAVRQSRCSRPRRRRWSMTSGTPPARKTRHRRMVHGSVRQHADQTGQRGSPRSSRRPMGVAGPRPCATAGRLEQQVGRSSRSPACTTMALCTARSGQKRPREPGCDVRGRQPRRPTAWRPPSRPPARTGTSAEWGIERPRASRRPVPLRLFQELTPAAGRAAGSAT